MVEVDALPAVRIMTIIADIAARYVGRTLILVARIASRCYARMVEVDA
jgi:hypothetical protein